MLYHLNVIIYKNQPEMELLPEIAKKDPDTQCTCTDSHGTVIDSQKCMFGPKQGNACSHNHAHTYFVVMGR